MKRHLSHRLLKALTEILPITTMGKKEIYIKTSCLQNYKDKKQKEDIKHTQRNINMHFDV